MEAPTSLEASSPHRQDREPTEPTNGQPRSGARLAGGGSPFLDNGYVNVPRVYDTPIWKRQQWAIRRNILDRLRLWQSTGYQCLWVTLTSSPDSTPRRLRAHFQVLRKRIGRDLGYQPMEYVCVDTREGHGVLHMIWAYRDPNHQKRASFYIPFDWLQEQWKGIHGAFHVNVKRIGASDKDSRRLARYIVAQYCGDQVGLVRLSQSKMDIDLKKMRSALKQEMRRISKLYEIAHEWGQIPLEEFSKRFNSLFWGEFRAAWDEFVMRRVCTVFEQRLAWIDGGIVRQKDE